MSRSNKDYIRRRAAEEDAERNAHFYETDEDRATAAAPSVAEYFAVIEQKLGTMRSTVLALGGQASLARVHDLATDLVALKHTVSDLSASLALQLALNEQTLAAERTKWEIALLQSIYKGNGKLRGHRLGFIDDSERKR